MIGIPSPGKKTAIAHRRRDTIIERRRKQSGGSSRRMAHAGNTPGIDEGAGQEKLDTSADVPNVFSNHGPPRMKPVELTRIVGRKPFGDSLPIAQ